MEEIYEINPKRLGGSKHFLARVDERIVELGVKKTIKGEFVERHLTEGFEHVTIKSGDSVKKAVLGYGKLYGKYSDSLSNYELLKVDVKPGRFYERIYRPVFKSDRLALATVSQTLDEVRDELLKYPDLMPFDNHHLLMSINQLSVFKEMLLDIASTVFPEPANLQTYGHSIKNLLVLACIEAETHLKGIYKAHELSAKKLYTTKDYVKLKELLKLEDYKVTYPFFSRLSTFRPFKGWDITNPTLSLSWYASYNAVKHDGELQFSKATLENCIAAISAVAILIHAQYGDRIPFSREKLGSFFQVDLNYKWRSTEYLLPPWEGNNWYTEKIAIV